MNEYICIKNIKIPKKCLECFALDDNGDYPKCLITGEQKGYNFNIFEDKMEKCPIIELPLSTMLLNDGNTLRLFHGFYEDYRKCDDNGTSNA